MMKKTKLSKLDKSERFWQLVEKQHGEVKTFGLSQYCTHNLDDTTSTKRKDAIHWGITYITDKGLFFYHFPQNNMLANLVGKTIDTGFCIALLYPQMDSWQEIPPARGLSRLFKKEEEGLFITGTSVAAPLVSHEEEHQYPSYINNIKKTLILGTPCRHTFLLTSRIAEIVTCLKYYVKYLAVHE